MSVNHTARIRPGDRWDGVSLTVTRADTDWARAQWAVVLRDAPRGAAVATMVAVVSVDEDTASLSFHLTGAETRILRNGRTYHGEVVVTIPSETAGDEPDLGPYTIFRWSLEAGDFNQVEGNSYSLTWSSTAASYAITLADGAIPGRDGVDGVGFELGDPLYIAPLSRNLWYTVDGTTYYPAVRSMVNSQPLLGWDGTAGTTNPT